MTTTELRQLEALLRTYRDDSVDRAEWDKRESVRFDVEFDAQIRGEE